MSHHYITLVFTALAAMLSAVMWIDYFRRIDVFEKEKIQLLRGPYGPYIKQGLRNYKLPKEKQDNAADLSIEEVKAMIEEAKANPPKKVPRRKKTS